MAGFTPEEIAAEMKRRDDAIARAKREGSAMDIRQQRANADTTCAHCGIPISSAGRFADFPLCDVRDGD